MKKLLYSSVLFLALFSAKAQVTKADFETLLNQYKLENMKSVYINSMRTFYTDGTNKMDYWEYKAPEISIELTASSLYVKRFTDNTKTTVKNIAVFPYNRIAGFSVSPTELTLRMIE